MPPTRFRARYSDVDRMGFLYHVNYLNYYELARSEWIRQFWKSYREIEDAGYAIVVIEANLTYRKPIHYDIEFDVTATLTDWGRSRLKFAYRISDPAGEVTYSEGWTSHCFIDRDGRPIGMPNELRSLIEKAGTVTGLNS